MQTTNSSTMQKLFPILTNKNVDMKKEIIAGVTTFLTMAYIIAVNPNILSETGMPARCTCYRYLFSSSIWMYFNGCSC